MTRPSAVTAALIVVALLIGVFTPQAPKPPGWVVAIVLIPAALFVLGVSVLYAVHGYRDARRDSQSRARSTWRGVTHALEFALVGRMRPKVFREMDRNPGLLSSNHDPDGRASDPAVPDTSHGGPTSGER